MAVTLISYATPDYSRAMKLLFRTAKKYGVDHTKCFSRHDLEQTEFYTKYKSILDRPRGNGYWLWKPYFIAETLRQLPEGDILIYSDAGIFFRKDIQPLIELVKNQYDTAFFYNDFRMGQLTKRDIFVALECDSPEYYNAPMVHAGFQVYRKTAGSLQFAEEVLRYSSSDRLITDDPNTCGMPNIEGFVENRHDQSVLSLVIHKHKRKVFADPSQLTGKPVDYLFGSGETHHRFIPYNRTIYIHRYRNSQFWKLIPDSIKKIFSRLTRLC